MLPEWHLLPYIAEMVFQLWDQLEVDFVSSIIYQSMSALLHIGSLWVECFQPSMAPSGKLCIFSSNISSSSSVQVSGITCYRSIQISDPFHTLLDGGSTVFTVLNMLNDITPQCPMVKDFIGGFPVDQVLKGLPSLYKPFCL